MVRDLFTPRDLAPVVRRAPEGPPPVWLTYRCARCGERVYSGFTTTALERKLAESPGVEPDFFHADCGVETRLADADLRTQEGAPWRPSIGTV
ncbi:MAG TPA: hypothetical protein VGR28_04480 [Candidatus Thermoplasmatota archaeon]|jgi:hypothetical protein|nr:hypothetical protein [Candidatus Thermoplasmatota archaeon]